MYIFIIGKFSSCCLQNRINVLSKKYSKALKEKGHFLNGETNIVLSDNDICRAMLKINYTMMSSLLRV